MKLALVPLLSFALWLAVSGCSSFEQPDAPSSEDLAKASEGAPASCTADADCGERQYCARPAGDCEGGAGRCTDRSEMCTRDWRPVCGCDGKTYGNACGAASAGRNVDYEGECR